MIRDGESLNKNNQLDRDTQPYALVADRFPTFFALVRFRLAGGGGIPNLSRLPISGGC